MFPWSCLHFCFQNPGKNICQYLRSAYTASPGFGQNIWTQNLRSLTINCTRKNNFVSETINKRESGERLCESRHCSAFKDTSSSPTKPLLFPIKMCSHSFQHLLQVWKSSLNIDPVELADAGRFFFSIIQQSRRWDCIWAVLPHLLIFTRYRCRVDFDISPTRWLFNLSHFLCKLLFNQTNMQLILYKPFFRRWERFCDQKNFYVF